MSRIDRGLNDARARIFTQTILDTVRNIRANLYNATEQDVVVLSLIDIARTDRVTACNIRELA